MFKKLVVGLLVMGLVLGLGSMVNAEKTKVTFLWGTEVSQIFPSIEREFEKAFPNIDLEIIAKPPAGRDELLWTWAAAGELPDVFGAPVGAKMVEWVDAKLVMPLNNLVVEIGMNTSEFPDWSFPQLTVEGELYGIPFGISFRGFLCYNKKVFDEAGVAYPTMDMSWEDLTETMRALTIKNNKGETVRYGLLCRDPQNDIIPAFGGRVVDNSMNPTKMTFGEAPYLKGMQWYRDCIDEGILMGRQAYDDEGAWKPKLFAEERFAMVVTDMGYGGNFTKAEIDWDVVTVPHTEENFGHLYNMGQRCVGYQSKNPKEALQFINWFITSEAGIKIWFGDYMPDNGNPPVLPSVQKVFAEIAQGRGPENWMATQSAVKVGVNGNPYWDGCVEIMGKYFDANTAVVIGKEPVEYLTEAAAECQEMLDKLNASK